MDAQDRSLETYEKLFDVITNEIATVMEHADDVWKKLGTSSSAGPGVFESSRKERGPSAVDRPPREKISTWKKWKKLFRGN